MSGKLRPQEKKGKRKSQSKGGTGRRMAMREGEVRGVLTLAREQTRERESGRGRERERGGNESDMKKERREIVGRVEEEGSGETHPTLTIN